MATNETPCRYVIGTMTGTSIDGIDVALVRIIGRGLAMHTKLLAHASRPLGDVGEMLRRLASGQPMAAEAIGRTAWAFGELHADLIHGFLADHNRADPPDLIVLHGQTIFHRPPISWQLINPAPIAARFNCPIVYDLRQADLAAGGQGAPITPIADWIMFRDAARHRAIVNLGGFCNITILPVARLSRPDESHQGEVNPCEAESVPLREILGFDLCVCNQLLDAIARRALDQPYDDRGRAATSGNVDDAIAAELLRILHEQHAAQRSLGTGDACAAWLEQHLVALAGPDLAASAVRAIGRCIGDRLRTANVNEVILAGGGARNEALVNTIRDSSSVPVALSDAHGIPAEAREAIAMAILGALSADRVPITVPHITGCRAPVPVAGVWSYA